VLSDHKILHIADQKKYYVGVYGAKEFSFGGKFNQYNKVIICPVNFAA
jgi:hypothetical protein